MVRNKFFVSCIALVLLSSQVAQEAVAGLVLDGNRITSWTLDENIGGLSAGTVISFVDGSYNDVPVNGTMPWFTGDSTNTNATALADKLLLLANANPTISTDSTHGYFFAYWYQSAQAVRSMYTFYSTNLNSWFRDSPYAVDPGSSSEVTPLNYNYAYIAGAPVPAPPTGLLGLLGIIGLACNRLRRRGLAAVEHC